MHNKLRVILFGALLLSAFAFSLVGTTLPAFSQSLGRSQVTIPQPRTPYMNGYRMGYRDAVTDCETSPGYGHAYRPTPKEEGYMDGYNYARANDPSCT
ncbi:hypothetical protein [Ktedonobacter robiniae]|uniref:Uncharacterized protein n=1 Tax=Ktedonobacter robiniae TaxID=2778365 RepID=A0ABQ3UH08_9CHLR|nr:hypothetical protein [Ktedonobacter robiniae]GHO51700.1 hypothetical protein KSB_01750 [Ktedonobacter robiniae]